MWPHNYPREPDEIQVSIYKNTVWLGFFCLIPVCFPYKAESYNLTCSHVYANTR